jgi:pSer/pThr/pTyr-binding forkhead associated (FHA) protein
VVQAIGAVRPKFLVTQLDGTEEGEFHLNEGENLVGREVGGMFAKDNLLSGRHATLIVQGQSVWVRDEGSRNGVYARIPRQQHVELNDGDQFCIGRIILRFEFLPSADAVGVLHLVVGRDVDKGMFPCRVLRTGVTLGRNRADLRFPLDGWISGLHCQIVSHGPQVMLVDLGSSNGTYLRIRGVRALAHHDALLMGQRIFHLHY